MSTKHIKALISAQVFLQDILKYFTRFCKNRVMCYVLTKKKNLSEKADRLSNSGAITNSEISTYISSYSALVILKQLKLLGASL